MAEIRDCPSCHAKDALETFLRIDLDDVVVGENDMVTSFVLAGSANDPTNGLVVEEARVTCRDCSYELPRAYVPESFMSRWHYYDGSPRRELAQKLAHMLNRQQDLYDSLTALGLDAEDLSAEEGLALDDPDNDVIDFHYDEHGECVYLQRHAGRWHVHTVRKEEDDASSEV